MESEDRLLEIYKLHTNIANETSNRRASVNRHFILILSGLILVTAAIGRMDKDSAANAIFEQFDIGYIVVLAGIFGLILSAIWRMSIESYLNSNAIRFEALMNLEHKLDYRFIQEEWGMLSPKQKTKTYREIASVELYTPVVFLTIFALMMIFGFNLVWENIYLAFVCSILLICSASYAVGYFSGYTRIRVRRRDNNGRA